MTGGASLRIGPGTGSWIQGRLRFKLGSGFGSDFGSGSSIGSVSPEKHHDLTLSDEAMEKEFVARAADEGMVELAGHRSVGGVRASIYNGGPVEARTPSQRPAW